MKIELTKNGQGSRALNDDGTEIQGLTSITVRAAVNEPTKAELELLFIETTTAECDQAEFMVGEHKGVVGLILKNGSTVMLGK